MKHLKMFEEYSKQNEGKISDFFKNTFKGLENWFRTSLLIASNTLDELVERGRITDEQAKETLNNDEFREEVKQVKKSPLQTADDIQETEVNKIVSAWINEHYPKKKTDSGQYGNPYYTQYTDDGRPWNV